MITFELNEWRELQWKQDGMINTLRDFKIRNDKVKQLNFLVYGPVGAGKSSIINTIKTIFEGRQYISCLAAQDSAKSQTLKFKKCDVGNTKDGFLPFTFSDIMGVEKENQCGVQADDIISTLKGHVKDDYVFNPISPLSGPNDYYLEHPSLSDRMHCLVYVIAADKISLIDKDTIQKMQKVRGTANGMDLPQVVFMTRVDVACSLTKENLRHVYKSVKIEKKMEECSVTLGVPMNCIFPVRNYYKETDIIEDINCLMLHTLTKIVHFADDYVVEYTRK
uniref:G domain-containing protein n=1 Tax=Astyanax mexicanus TaxID=7994 RepID=A0A8B9GRP7_ASTMX